MHTRKLLAVGLAGVLGIVAGVVTAFLLPGATGTAGSDPLDLGISLKDQPCTGQSLILVGWGVRASQLNAAVTNNPAAHYLEADRSCDTRWKHLGPGRNYVAYLGPFTIEDACSLRMRVEHKGDYVTRLNAGNSEFVQCGCVVPYRDMPSLHRGMTPTTISGIWVHTLQQMLFQSRLLVPLHFTGTYDAATEATVERLQTDHALQPTGMTDAATWAQVQKSACGLYTF